MSPQDPDPLLVVAPMHATVVHVAVEPGQVVAAGAELVVLEAMKMQHPVRAPQDGLVRSVGVAVGDTVVAGAQLARLDFAASAPAAEAADGAAAGGVRADLAEVRRRHETTLDDARQTAVVRRHRGGRRTARENVAALCDQGTFVEYGGLAVAGRRARTPLDELIASTPADGLVGGIGEIGGAQAVVMSYDYTVLAGTQGLLGHRKKDRLFELAERRRLPVVLFAEGGGGRPGDTDAVASVSQLDTMAFALFAQLSGTVPLVGIASGRCFAGNAALLGCCDVVIATEDANIGMGGPAMVEGGGLGVVTPEEIGPIGVQTANGVVDVAVTDDAAAVDAAQRYLAYFTGPAAQWDCTDQARLRDAVPADRLRVYDVRPLIDDLADTASVLELRRDFGIGAITALVRVEGAPMGLIASNPAHLGGAIDAEAADKVARFLQLCEAHRLPVVSLVDTPGFMVGPDAERTATVRHVSRMFVTGANLTVPLCAVVLRKAYGLGAMAMTGGSLKTPMATVAWPTGEFGAMGLEGAVRLGYRAELAAITDPTARQARYDELVGQLYEQGAALSAATVFEIDDVIDPADTRRWITTALAGPVPDGPARPFVDTW